MDTKQFSTVPVYEELDDEGGSAVPSYWDPADDVDPATGAGHEEGVTRQFVRLLCGEAGRAGEQPPPPRAQPVITAPDGHHKHQEDDRTML